MNKTCRDCKETLPIDQFQKHGTAADGYSNLCRQCKQNTYLPWRKKSIRSKPGYLYMFRAPDSMYKIGITTDVNLRWQSVKAQSPTEIEIVYHRYFQNVAPIEREVHGLCREYHSHFEWFKLPEHAFMSVLEFLKAES